MASKNKYFVIKNGIYPKKRKYNWLLFVGKGTGALAMKCIRGAKGSSIKGFKTEADAIEYLQEQGVVGKIKQIEPLENKQSYLIIPKKTEEEKEEINC